MTQRIGVDWFRLLWDLVQRGVTLREIAKRCGIAESTLKGYLQGSHPPHWRGEVLIALWCDLCDRPRIEVPVAAVPFAPRLVREAKLQASPDACAALERAWR